MATMSVDNEDITQQEYENEVGGRRIPKPKRTGAASVAPRDPSRKILTHGPRRTSPVIKTLLQGLLLDILPTASTSSDFGPFEGNIGYKQLSQLERAYMDIPRFGTCDRFWLHRLVQMLYGLYYYEAMTLDEMRHVPVVCRYIVRFIGI
ncbi:hypothetical protein MRX96_014674 [Rhipicephalus microplus]